MSMSQVAPIAAVLGGAVIYAVSAVIPAPPPIVVHSLTYRDGAIVQDRTITGTSGATLMTWGAQIVNAETDMPVLGCTGSGTWPYASGRAAYTLPLADWVGSDNCILTPGLYFPRAVYSDGANPPVTKVGDVFEVRQ